MGSLEEAEIWAELEARLGRPATFEEYEKVAERLPEFYSRHQLKRIVERLVAIEKNQAIGWRKGRGESCEIPKFGGILHVGLEASETCPAPSNKKGGR